MESSSLEDCVVILKGLALSTASSFRHTVLRCEIATDVIQSGELERRQTYVACTPQNLRKDQPYRFG